MKTGELPYTLMGGGGRECPPPGGETSKQPKTEDAPSDSAQRILEVVSGVPDRRCLG